LQLKNTIFNILDTSQNQCDAFSMMKKKPKRKRALTKYQISELVARINNGGKRKFLAEFYGVTYETIKTYLRCAGDVYKPRGNSQCVLTPEQVAELVTRARNGEKHRVLTYEYGISQTSLSVYIRSAKSINHAKDLSWEDI
jgi:uncharacterized protein (DUF433 family)